MDKWEGKVAVVSGASAGMGNCLVKELVKYGMIVVGVARQVDIVEKLANELKKEKGKLIPKKCDLLKEEDIRSVFSYIENNLGGIAVIVNMAGNSTRSSLIENTDIEKMEKALEINVMATALFCKLGIASMKKHNIDGHIINVGGTASYFTSVMETCHFYSVAKFILRALTDGLRMEFRSNNINIRIANIGPGHVKAGTQERGGLKGDDLYELFKLYADEVYKVKKRAVPAKIPFNCDGDGLYYNNILPALEMTDIVDCIIQMLSSPQGCEVMDMIVKPTDRNHSIYETDFYWRP